MKKRLISLFTAIVILASFGSGLSVSASLKGTSCENEAALLASVGILPKGAVTSLNTSNPITRQEFAEYVIKALGETEESVSEYSEKFTDFTATGYVAKGVALGFVNGYPDGSFKPSQNVTTAEAEKMIIDAVGYTYMTNLKGGDYPDSYVAVASEVGLSKNVNKGANAQLNVQDMVFLIYNMLNLEIPLMKVDGSAVTFEKEITVLSEKFDIKKGSGLVTANEYTGISRIVGVSRGTVEINNAIFEIGESGVENYLGYNVEYYYREDGDGNTIMFADPSKKSEDLRVYAKEIDRLENDKYYYFNGDDASKTSTAVLSKNFDVIYNGRAMLEIRDTKIFTPDFGSVTLIDNNRDGKYDIVSITDRRVLVLSMYDNKEFAFYDKYILQSDTANKVIIDPEDDQCFLKIKNSQGAAVALEALKEWDVLEIAQSVDGMITDIIVHSESFTGTINSIGYDSENREILTINSQEYVVADKINKYNLEKGTKFQNSQTYNFILNSDGTIVGCSPSKEVATDGKYGYLISVKKDETEDEFIWIKMFTLEGVTKTIKSTKKIRLDGELGKAIEKFDDLNTMLFRTEVEKNGIGEIISSKVVINAMVVYYKTDTEGNIREIDTTNRQSNESVNSLMVKGKVENEKYTKSHRTISGKINFDENSVVFITPAYIEDSSEKDFAVKPALEYFGHYGSYTVKGYSRDRVSPFTEAAVVNASAGAKMQDDDELYLVQRVNVGINEDDQEVAILELINGSGIKTYKTIDMEVPNSMGSLDPNVTISPSEQKVTSGDIIRISKNKSDEINLIQIVYRPTTGKLYCSNNPSSKGDYLAKIRVSLSNVFYKTDKYLRVVGPEYDLTNKDVVKKIENGDIVIENLECANVFVYEPNEKVPYRAGTVNEIRDYYGSGVASKVFARTNDADTGIIVIYK